MCQLHLSTTGGKILAKREEHSESPKWHYSFTCKLEVTDLPLKVFLRQEHQPAQVNSIHCPREGVPGAVFLCEGHLQLSGYSSQRVACFFKTLGFRTDWAVLASFSLSAVFDHSLPASQKSRLHTGPWTYQHQTLTSWVNILTPHQICTHFKNISYTSLVRTSAGLMEKSIASEFLTGLILFFIF